MPADPNAPRPADGVHTRGLWRQLQHAQQHVGGVAATNVSVGSTTSITATAPAGSAGAVDVVVTVSGQSGRLPGGFTYVAQLTLTTYYGGGQPDWSLFYGAMVPNGGAAQDPLGQKGTVT